MLPVGCLAGSISQVIGHNDYVPAHYRHHLVIEELQRRSFFHVERAVLDAQQMVVRSSARRHGYYARCRDGSSVGSCSGISNSGHIDIAQQSAYQDFGQIDALRSGIVHHHVGNFAFRDMLFSSHPGQILIGDGRVLARRVVVATGGQKSQHQQQRQKFVGNVTVHLSVYLSG